MAYKKTELERWQDELRGVKPPLTERVWFRAALLTLAVTGAWAMRRWLGY